jgi:hypothetical protein
LDRMPRSVQIPVAPQEEQEAPSILYVKTLSGFRRVDSRLAAFLESPPDRGQPGADAVLYFVILDCFADGDTRNDRARRFFTTGQLKGRRV